jgi:hypothetical protein
VRALRSVVNGCGGASGIRWPFKSRLNEAEAKPLQPVDFHTSKTLNSGYIVS